MTTWHLDQDHLHVGFAVKHMMVTTVRGRFTDVHAEIEIDEETPARSLAEVRIGTASVDTAHPDRDAHLRSADFFDAETYPLLSFRSTNVERAGDKFTLLGDLTVRDVTRPVRLEGEIEGPVTDSLGNRRAGFTLTGELDREEFGLTWNMAVETGGVVVGRKVKLSIEGAITADASEADASARTTADTVA